MEELGRLQPIGLQSDTTERLTCTHKSNIIVKANSPNGNVLK